MSGCNICGEEANNELHCYYATTGLNHKLRPGSALVFLSGIVEDECELICDRCLNKHYERSSFINVSTESNLRHKKKVDLNDIIDKMMDMDLPLPPLREGDCDCEDCKKVKP